MAAELAGAPDNTYSDIFDRTIEGYSGAPQDAQLGALAPAVETALKGSNGYPETPSMLLVRDGLVLEACDHMVNVIQEKVSTNPEFRYTTAFLESMNPIGRRMAFMVETWSKVGDESPAKQQANELVVGAKSVMDKIYK